MLGRRNLRIKVMQALYAWEMDHDTPLTRLEGLLKTQIQRSVSLYLTHLQFLMDVCQYSLVDKAKRLAKYIKTEEDEKASTTIAANRIILFLEQDALYNDFVKKENIRHMVSEGTVRNLFIELATKQKYKDYAKLEQPTAKEDKEIISFIFKKIFATNKELEQHLEEHFINYDDDNALLLHVTGKYVDAFDENKKNNFFLSMDAWAEEQKFALDLLAKCIQLNEELGAIIQPKLKNWDMDRVAILDLILLKMAVCELKHFPTIPIKVTINEYIDISKLYSTPKSKDFVNGVLDRIKNEMQDKGEIKKFGRGLME
ncbi:MAG: transcription antitermination factor NusB [Bacteroidetes bacterium]|nr:transcription antitermination factor NusB [Bacteroidota bacterium]